MKYLFALVLLIAGLVLAYDVAGPVKSGSRNTQTQGLGPQYSDNESGLTGEASIPPSEIRVLYFNPDGSCVQCSFGMHGVKCNNPNAESLLWDTKYGPGVHGGSTPSRVSAYCNARGIDAWVVTGEATWEMMKRAAVTGRGAAVSLESRHFQFVTDYDAKNGIWFVCDNRTPKSIDAYLDNRFSQLHVDGGQWCVVLNCHAPPCAFKRELKSITLSKWTWLNYLFA